MELKFGENDEPFIACSCGKICEKERKKEKRKANEIRNDERGPAALTG